MTTATSQSNHKNEPPTNTGADNAGKKFFVNIEGNELPWPQETITTEEIANLGGWDVSQGVIEVDDDNNERTLTSGEVIPLKPGHGFGKKHKWKRG